MTDLKYKLLRAIYHADPVHHISRLELLSCKAAPVYEIEAALEDLIFQGFVTSAVGSANLKLTSTGRIAYEEAEEKRQQKTESERQQRFDNKISVASVLIPFVTFILGIVVEHFSGFVGWLASLFSQSAG